MNASIAWRVLPLIALTASGCYQYRPVQGITPELREGSEIRLRLAEPRPMQIGATLFEGIGVVEGEVYRSAGDTLGVSSRYLHTAFGSRHRSNGAILFFDRSGLGLVERRQLNPIQTGIVTGAALGALVAVFLVATQLGGSSGPGGDGTGGPDVRISFPF